MPTFLWHQLTPKFTWPSQNKPKKNSQKIRGQLFPQLCPLLHPGGGHNCGNYCIFECVWIWIYLSHRHGLTANVSQLILAEHILIRHTAPIYPFHKVHLFVWGVFVLPLYDFSFPVKLELSNLNTTEMHYCCFRLKSFADILVMFVAF